VDNEPKTSAGDTSAEYLIRAAVPLLDKLIGMWVVGRDDKRLARAMRDALTSQEGVEIATKIAKYYNPYGEAEVVAAGTLSGNVELVYAVPGDNELIVTAGDNCAVVSAGIPMKIDSAGPETIEKLATWILENPCFTAMTVDANGRATNAEFVVRKT
jgi:hypothetical protein